MAVDGMVPTVPYLSRGGSGLPLYAEMCGEMDSLSVESK